MRSSVKARTVRFDAHRMWVDLMDGRSLGVPLAWFPRLLNSSLTQRKKVRISPRGLHWDEIGEDISIAGLLAGKGDRTPHKKDAA